MSKERRRRLEDAARRYDDGDLPSALAGFEAVVAEDPQEIGALHRIADILRELGRDAEAVERYAGLVDRYAQDGLHLKAMAVAKTVIALDPTRADVMDTVARLCARPRAPSLAPGEKRKQSAPKVGLDRFLVGPAPEAGEAVPKIPLFGSLPKNAFLNLMEGMKLLEPKAGETIIREGERGDSFFALTSGRVRVEKRVDEKRAVVLAYLSEGAFFGEMALLSDAPRNASVLVEGDGCRLFELSKPVLDDTVAAFPSVARVLRDFYRDRLLSTTMALHPLFRPFGPHDRRRLMGMFKSKRFEPGEVLISEGEPGAGLYLLLTGTAEVASGGRRLATLGPGDLFGEMSLLGDAPTAATITAAVELLVLRLPKESFEAVASANPHVPEMLGELQETRNRANRAQLLSGVRDADDVLV